MSPRKKEETKSFEENMKRLEEIVSALEQIVVNEGIGVDALQRRAQRKGLPGLPAQRLAEGQGHHGPDPLAPRQQAGP